MQEKFKNVINELIDNIFYTLKHKFGIIQSIDIGLNQKITIYHL
jgi:hypothetical protein